MGTGFESLDDVKKGEKIVAVKTIEEIIASVQSRIGDDTSDDALTLLEDVSDTLNDFNLRLTDSGDWKTKYEENDKKWREKYKERFTTGETIKEKQEEQVKEDNTIRTFDELFTEREG